MAVWFLLLALFTVAIGIEAPASIGPAIFMALGGAAIVVFGRHLAATDEQTVISHLEAVCEARACRADSAELPLRT